MISLESYLPFLFPFIGIGFFSFILFVLSRFGWYAYARKYATLVKPQGQVLSYVSGRVNFVNYNSTLGIVYNKEGLYLHPELVFKLFHKPLFIPWKDIKYKGVQSFFIVKYAKLSIGTPEIGSIKIQFNVFEKFQNYLEKAD